MYSGTDEEATVVRGPGGAVGQAAASVRRLARPGDAPRAGGQAGHDLALTTVKMVHTMVWLSVESCMLYVLYTGFTGRSGRRAAIAAGVVAGESLVFAANGFRCPLTGMAERLGAERGAITDIYLPRRLARNLPAIHVPLILLAAFLHGRNIRQAGTYHC